MSKKVPKYHDTKLDMSLNGTKRGGKKDQEKALKQENKKKHLSRKKNGVSLRQSSVL